jgi:hypothetical protein
MIKMYVGLHVKYPLFFRFIIPVVFTCINTLRTGDANLRFFAFVHYNCERRMTQICVFNTRLVSTHFITQYMERFSEWSSGPDV